MCHVFPVRRRERSFNGKGEKKGNGGKVVEEEDEKGRRAPFGTCMLCISGPACWCKGSVWCDCLSQDDDDSNHVRKSHASQAYAHRRYIFMQPIERRKSLGRERKEVTTTKLARKALSFRLFSFFFVLFLVHAVVFFYFFFCKCRQRLKRWTNKKSVTWDGRRTSKKKLEEKKLRWEGSA